MFVCLYRLWKGNSKTRREHFAVVEVILIRVSHFENPKLISSPIYISCVYVRLVVIPALLRSSSPIPSSFMAFVTPFLPLSLPSALSTSSLRRHTLSTLKAPLGPHTLLKPLAKRARPRALNTAPNTSAANHSNLHPSPSSHPHSTPLSQNLAPTQAWHTLLNNALVTHPTSTTAKHPAWLTPARPRVLKESRRSAKKNGGPHRKVHGYWNDLSNVERELRDVNAQLGRPDKRIVPKLSEMRMLGRGDLVAALGKHGGIKKVADDLRWGRGGKTRRMRRGDGAAVVPGEGKATLRKGVREKLLRRPRKYWEDVERVKMEIGAFVAEYGVKGVMPTQKQFYQFRRADLVQAAGRHGGLRVVAGAMGLKCRRRTKEKCYWREFETVRNALLEFAAQHCGGCMPTGDELNSNGCSGLRNAIVAHGGFTEVAKRVGLTARNTRAQGAPVRWEMERLRMEVHAFVMGHFPELARRRLMPSEGMLRRFGRNDLSYAISKFGGYRKVAEAMGLEMKRGGVYRSRKAREGEEADEAEA